MIHNNHILQPDAVVFGEICNDPMISFPQASHFSQRSSYICNLLFLSLDEASSPRGLLFLLFILLPGQGSSICKAWIKLFVGGRIKWFCQRGRLRRRGGERWDCCNGQTQQMFDCGRLVSAAVGCETETSQCDLYPAVLCSSSASSLTLLYSSSFLSSFPLLPMLNFFLYPPPPPLLFPLLLTFLSSSSSYPLLFSLLHYPFLSSSSSSSLILFPFLFSPLLHILPLSPLPFSPLDANLLFSSTPSSLFRLPFSTSLFLSLLASSPPLWSFVSGWRN